MFSHEFCSKPGCHNFALSRFLPNGEIVATDSFCLKHHPDIEGFKYDLINYIKNHEKIVGLSAYGLTFENHDFSGKRFYGCNMQHCIFTNIHSENFRSRRWFLQFLRFEEEHLIERLWISLV